MAQLQYIGARYVPKWYVNTNDQTADWQINVEYEPLTWVTTTNNHLYLSKKTVPDNIGNPADNTEYWLDMGVFTGGQYDELQGEIDDINDDLSVVHSDITSLDGRVTALEGDTKEKYYFCIGDSYSVSNPSLNCYWDLAGEELGIDSDHWINNSVIGFGLGDGSWLTNLTTWVGNNPDVVPKITDIFIIGGYNDAGYSYADLVTAFSNLLKYIRTNFTNVENIYTACIGWSASTATTARTGIANSVRPAYRNSIYQGCINIACLENVFHNYVLFQNDDVHPNQTGQNYLAHLFVQYLKTGWCEPATPLHFAGVTWTGVLPTANGDLELYQKGDVVILNFKYTAAWTTYTAISDNLTVIGTIPARTGVLRGTNYCSFPINFAGHDVIITVDGNTIYANCAKAGDSIPNATPGYVRGGTIMIPCDRC